MIERSISFGENGGLVGTLCLPSGSNKVHSGIGVILFNAGVVHRVGPHRINVRLARILADHEIPSIRFDLAGLGDSTRPNGTQSFEAQAVSDIRTAMDALAAATGLNRFTLFGFCSGAYHSYATALADGRVVGVQLFDAYRYPTPRLKWNRIRMRVKQYGIVRVAGGLLRRALMLPLQYFRNYAQSEHGTESRGDVGNIVYTPSKSEFASNIKILLDRGVKIAMLHAGDSFYHYNYSYQLEEAFKGFAIMDRVTTTFFPDMDHVATSMADQAAFMHEIEQWIVKLDGEYCNRSPVME